MPFFWMISTSFKPIQEVFSRPPSIIPQNPIISNYINMIFETSFPYFMRNSIIITTFTTIIAMVVALSTGYGISRFKFRGKTFFSAGLIAVQMFPPMMLLIPMFIIMRRLGLLNSHLSLIIAYGSFAIPFCSWMLKGYIDTVPISIEEAALIDGCSRLQVIYRILIPVIGPGLVTVSMFAFVLAWREYLFALTFSRTETMRTLTVGLALMQGQHGTVEWGQIMAGSVITTIPPLLFFLYIEKYIVKGFTMGAVKE